MFLSDILEKHAMNVFLCPRSCDDNGGMDCMQVYVSQVDKSLSLNLPFPFILSFSLILSRQIKD